MADAEYPGSIGSDALTGVIEKLIPPRAYTYLFATLPGLFFEISILVANPARMCELVAKARDGFGLRHYEVLGLALFLAFVIGNAFMLLVGFVQLLFIKLYPRTLKAKEQQIPDEDRVFWAKIARQLLGAKYGIDPKALDQNDWNVLYQSLGVPAQEDVRASILMMTLEAMGWCGLAAMLFAPGVRNLYYFIFSLAFIAAGLLHDWQVAELRENPHQYGLLRVRLLLEELGRLEAISKPSVR
jgi:hypothetical protein